MLWDEPKIFFLERRYFFSIILSEFLKNRVALQTASGKAYGEGETDANVKLVWQNNPCATMKTDTGIKGGAVKATAPAIAQIVSAGSTSSTGGYYYHPTTDTKADETKGSPKTFDAGVGIYAVTAVLSVTGMAWVGKKRH